MDRDDDLVVPGMLTHHEVARALDAYRAELHAKVEALLRVTKPFYAPGGPYPTPVYSRDTINAVLDLIDGSSDG